jgi:hypothetical protein
MDGTGLCGRLEILDESLQHPAEAVNYLEMLDLPEKFSRRRKYTGLQLMGLWTVLVLVCGGLVTVNLTLKANQSNLLSSAQAVTPVKTSPKTVGKSAKVVNVSANPTNQ